MSLSDTLSAGGYGVYIWPAYGAALVILGGFTVAAVLRHRAARQALGRLETRRRGRAA